MLATSINIWLFPFVYLFTYAFIGAPLVGFLFWTRYNPQSGAYEAAELEHGDYVWHMWVDEGSREYQEWLIGAEAQNVGDTAWESRNEFEYVMVMIEG